MSNQCCDVSICIDGEQTFFLHQKIISAYSGKLKKMIKQEKRIQKEMVPIKSSTISLDMYGFPGGSNGFELISRFCYNNAQIGITVSNISLLYCSAVFLEMNQNLFKQTDSFLEGIFYWSWNDILESLKSCAQHTLLLRYADSYGLLDRLVCALLAKIAQNPLISRIESPSGTSNCTPTRGSGATSRSLLDPNSRILDDTSSCKPRLGYPKAVRSSCGANQAKIHSSSTNSSSSSYSSSPTPTSTPNPKNNGPLAKILASSFSSSPSSSSPTTAIQSSSQSQKQWWFDDLSALPPVIIEKLIKNLGSYGKENDSIILARFILHYLNKRPTISKIQEQEVQLYSGLADTAVYGIISNCPFSCRGLLRILRTVSGFGLSKSCRVKLERLIGSMLDEATLDDLLISGQERGDYYDVKLVLRLIRIFVNGEIDSSERMKKVGKLIDKYIAEISPDHNLKMSKFVGVAQSLPDSARDCFDSLYKAIDMFLQSHPTLTSEERSKVCKCLNFEKLSLEVCKEMAKNPRIPPTTAIQALKSQTKSKQFVNENYKEENEDMKMNIERMQSRVIQLEKACKEMKGQMSLLVRQNNFDFIPTFNSPTRLC